jgi:hypothetical protein
MKRREVVIGISHPVAVRMIVEQPNEGDDWEIKSIRDARAEVTVRTAGESMCDDDFIELNRLAAKAKDL